jgi:hypothetical protein
MKSYQEKKITSLKNDKLVKTCNKLKSDTSIQLLEVSCKCLSRAPFISSIY